MPCTLLFEDVSPNFSSPIVSTHLLEEIANDFYRMSEEPASKWIRLTKVYITRAWNSTMHWDAYLGRVCRTFEQSPVLDRFVHGEVTGTLSGP